MNDMLSREVRGEELTEEREGEKSSPLEELPSEMDHMLSREVRGEDLTEEHEDEQSSPLDELSSDMDDMLPRQARGEDSEEVWEEELSSVTENQMFAGVGGDGSYGELGRTFPSNVRVNGC